MSQERYELIPGEEILTNGKYKKVVSLQGILPDIEKEIGKTLLSIRARVRGNGSIEQYNIETKKYITNISSHNGIDIHMFQYNKINRKEELFSPYSDPGYNMYANLLCAYYEFFQKKPLISFYDTDKEDWNSIISPSWSDLSMVNEMVSTYTHVYSYLHFYERFKQDSEWIYRLTSVGKNNDPRTDEGIGIQNDEAIFQMDTEFKDEYSTSRIHIEKDLINLFMQAFIDTNRCVSWAVANLNLKKITEVLFDALNTPEIRQDSEKFNIRNWFTPLQ